MTRPAIEVADILRRKGRQYLQRYQSCLSYQQLKAYRAVSRCRTAALGGHKDKCVGCQYEAPISYNSCRSRCCPKCQAQARRRWLEVAATRSAQHQLLPCRVHRTPRTEPAGPDYSPTFLRSACSMPAPRPCSKWPPIPTARRRDRIPLHPAHLESEPAAATTMSTASSPAADYPPITGDGSRPATRCSCCPFRYCATSSATSSSPDSGSSTARTCSTAAVLPPISVILPGSSN